MSQPLRSGRRYSLRFKILVPLFLAGVLFTVLGYLGAQMLMSAWLHDELNDRAQGLVETLQATTADSATTDIQIITLAEANRDDVELIVVYDPVNEKIIASSNSWNNLSLNQVPDPNIRAALSNQISSMAMMSDDNYVFTDPVAFSGQTGTLSNSFALIQLDAGSLQRDATIATWLLTGAVALVALFILGVAHSQLTRYVITPVREIDAGIRSTRSGSGAGATVPKNRDELGSLADTLASNAQKVNQTTSNRQSVRSSISHFDTTLTMQPNGRIIDAYLAPDQDLIPRFIAGQAMDIDQLLPTDVAELLLEEFDAVVATGDSLEFEFEYFSYGAKQIYEVRAQARNSSQLDVVIRDMTSRKRLEDEAQSRALRLRELVDQAPVVMVELSPDGTILSLNRLPIDRQHRDDPVGQNLEFMLPDNARSSFGNAFESVRATSRSQQFQISVPVAGTEQRWLCDLVPLPDAKFGDRVLFGATNINAFQAEQIRLREQIELLQAGRTEVDAEIEQLRAQLAKTRDENDAIKVQYERQIREMSDTGRDSQVDQASATLRLIVEGVLEAFTPVARAKDIELNSVIPHHLESTMIVHPVEISRILSQLADNAIESTDTGIVQISAVSRPEESDAETLKFEIMDSGSGMSEQAIRELNALCAGGRSNIAALASTGISGLDTILETVVRLNGRMGTKKSAGGGTIFWFTSEIVH